VEKNLEIKIDIAKNRCIMSPSGSLPDDQVKQVIDRVIAELSKLKPGFDMVVDIRHAKVATPKVSEEMKRITVFCLENKCRRVIRVVGDSVITQMQLDRHGKEIGLGSGGTAASLEEAERILDTK
jgi:hypothetical protein